MNNHVAAFPFAALHVECFYDFGQSEEFVHVGEIVAQRRMLARNADIVGVEFRLDRVSEHRGHDEIAGFECEGPDSGFDQCGADFETAVIEYFLELVNLVIFIHKFGVLRVLGQRVSPAIADGIPLEVDIFVLLLMNVS